MIPPILITAAVSAAIGAGGAWAWQSNAYERQLSELRNEHAQTEQLRSETARMSEAGHRARERNHADTVQAITTKADNEKTRLAAELQRALDSLRNRPQRPATAGGAVPESAADPVACTGAELFRPDAEFLVREAARADQLRAALGQCQAAYDAAVTLTAPL